MFEQLRTFWPQLLALFGILVSVAASSHVILNKRDVRSAIGWVGIIWLSPIIGTAVYFLFGVNRIHRRAYFRRGRAWKLSSSRVLAWPRGREAREIAAEASHLQSLARLIDRLTDTPLVSGNKVVPLCCGDEAFPAMLAAIDGAQHSVSLSTYIFDNDHAGRTFLDTLKRAVGRGVQVRVLIDSVGSRYTWPSIVGLLEEAEIRVARFMPTLIPAKFQYANLRNHRKIMVVDGRIGFTGGVNIREGNLIQQNFPHPIRDMHFRLEGPIVEHLQDTFANDWQFTTGEEIDGEIWYPDLRPSGDVLARGIADGPDEDFDKFRMTLLGAISCARSSIIIMTPYFLPDFTLTTTLSVAAGRGIDVRIILPSVNNLTMVQWASTAELRQVLEGGSRVWMSPPPFDHTKLMVVDGIWTLIGSANWDARSLRLNFEFNVEVYSRELAEAMTRHALASVENTPELTLEELNNRPLWKKIRDGAVRLASPYL